MTTAAVPIHFAGDSTGVEVLKLSDLRRRLGAQLHRYERLDFNLYLLPTTGRGSHCVDFVEHSCHPGRLIHVSPGRVHRFAQDATFEADMLLVHPRGLSHRTTRSESAFDLGRSDHGAFQSLVGLLEQQLTAGKVNVVAVRSLVAAWTAIMEDLPATRGASSVTSTSVSIAHAFTDLLEDNFARWRRVEDYASALACSHRTVYRATVATFGLTPKQLIDERVMLEAMRLLALGDQSVESIGQALGFAQASNFTAAFRRVTGTTPREFRMSQSA